MMYKHRPAYPALLASAVIFISGAAVTMVLRNRALEGEGGIQPALLAGMLTVALSGAALISAFARYKYTHLWKSTGARHSDKYKKVEDRLRKSRTSRG
jgi:hypothetical protein